MRTFFVILAALGISTARRRRRPVFSLAWSPDGSKLALGGFREVRIIDERTGGAVATLVGHADAVRSIAFSPDGKLLYAAGGLPGRSGEVKVWDAVQNTLLRTIKGHSDCLYATAVSPDGRLLATSGYDKSIRLWDTATGEERRTLKDHIDAIYALAGRGTASAWCPPRLTGR